MSEIRNALVRDVRLEISDSQPAGSELIRFMTLGNPHDEEVTPGGALVRVVDFHGHEISFGIPIERLDELRQVRLINREGDFLTFRGADISGNARAYSLRIEPGMLSRMAYQIFVTLSSERGPQFAREHMLSWESWMR